MPIPGGEITTSQIWVPEQPEEVQEQEAKQEVTEDEKLDIAIKIHEGEL